MREIKFRYWDKENKKMYGGFDLTDATFNHEENRGGTAIIMQFTGLKDMNGKEIYEGDLVVCHLSGERIGVVDTVLYNDESAAFEFKRRYTTIKEFLEHDGLFDTEIEVIGNIHENPELLNQK